MRIITWNIHQGGGKRSTSILDAISKIDADVCVLTEFNEVRSESLMKTLGEEGWSYQESSFSKEKGVGLAVVSRVKIQFGDLPKCPEEGRWLHVKLPNQDIEVCAAYAPLASQLKGEYWDWMIDAAQPLLGRKALIVGDFNNGLFPADHPEGASPLPK
jgi:exonuclease III